MKPEAAVATEKQTNRLGREKSPYLLQHAYNPVDWYPWGEAAFAKARKEKRPIFLSIGYSTCHWCHVMERESFEDAEVARLLNQDFVSIKVDREERPDVDAVYMTYVQAVTGSGGWPMSVWLTPGLKPFYGGTYFPPEDRDGRPGLKTLLARIAEVWRTDSAKIEASGEAAVDQLQEAAGRAQGGQAVPAEAPEAAYERIRESYDPVYGGFGGAPKFPRPATLHFLLRHAARTGNSEALAMAVNTLRRMAEGGVYDRLGGGFHRYAVDERWRLPHFEKMMYDQAQLSAVYRDAFLITRDPALGAVAREILEYVRREMTGPEGQFYSAEDADSPEPGHPESLVEGAFYVWEAAEIRAALGDRSASIVSRRAGVKLDGNVMSAGELSGKNVLLAAEPVEALAKTFNATPDEVNRILEQGRARLFEVRGKRPRPRLDDKAIAAWNGLMISSYAKAYQVFGDASYLEAAEHALHFIRHRLERDSNQLWRRYRAGESAVEGTALDYAAVIQGALDLYEASFDPHLLEWALRLQDRQNRLFLDPAAGGYFEAPADPRLLLRLKEAYDGAEPSVNSISALNLLRLHHLAPEKGYEAMADALFVAFSQALRDSPDSAPQLMAAFALRQRGITQVVLAGTPHSPDLRTLVNAIRHVFLPDVMVIQADGGAGQAELVKRLPFMKGMMPLDGKARAYVCKNFACQSPTTDGRMMMEQLAPPFSGERRVDDGRTERTGQS
jgi:uncharacterized protein YyaL (SSP411 family)